MKNKLRLLTFGILTILLAGACKKNTTTTGGGGTNTNASITPSTATNYFAILSVTAVQSIYYGSLGQPINLGAAYFSNTATPANNPSTFVKVNSVSLNSTAFKFNSYDYGDTTYHIVYPSGVWQVNGLANIPSFTYTSTTPLPTYTGYATLPDTIHKGQTITLSITGITGSDQTTVIISDGANGAGHLVSQTLLAGANSVTFQAATLSGLTTNTGTTVTSAFINVGCMKNNAQAVNGLPMNFPVSYQLDKQIYIKP